MKGTRGTMRNAESRVHKNVAIVHEVSSPRTVVFRLYIEHTDSLYDILYVSAVSQGCFKRLKILLYNLEIRNISR